MGLRMIASVLGAGPRDLPKGEPLRSYAKVAAWAIGLGGGPDAGPGAQD
jgi:hypothetical protein